MGYFNDSQAGNTASVFATIGVCLGIAWITLMLRLWVRAVMIKGTGWDDAVLLFSAVCYYMTLADGALC